MESPEVVADAPLALGGPFLVRKSLQDGKRRIIEGICSTPDEDHEGERISEEASNYQYWLRRAAINKAILDRFDWSAFENQHGWLRWEHKDDSAHACRQCGGTCFREPETIVGFPLEVEKSYTFRSHGGMPRVGTRLLAELFPAEAKNKFADATWLLMNSIAKSSTTRRLGFSIEGAYIDDYAGMRRNQPDTRKAILVSNCVLTTHPVNPHTMAWTTVRKSLLGIESRLPAREPAACACKALTVGGGSSDASALTGGAALLQQSHHGASRCRKRGCTDPSHRHDALDDQDVRKAVITQLLARGYSREVITNVIADRLRAD